MNAPTQHSLKEAIRRSRKQSAFKGVWITALIIVALLVYLVPRLPAILEPVEKMGHADLVEAGKDPGGKLYEAHLEWEGFYTFSTYLKQDDVPSDYFVALITEDGFFTLAQVPSDVYDDEAATHYLGHFESISSEIRENILEDLVNEGLTESESEAVMPTHLFVVEDIRPVLYGFLAGLIVAMIVFLVQLFRWLSSGSGASIPGLQRAVNAVGGDYDMVSMELEAAYEDSAHPGLGFTRRYVVTYSGGSVSLYPYEDVLWAYEKVVKHKYLFVITVGKAYHLRVCGVNQESETPMKHKQRVQNALEAIHRHCPHAIIGYSNEVNRLYKHDRNTLVAEINRHKREASVPEADSGMDSDYI